MFIPHRIKAKLEEKRGSRINVSAKVPKVNSSLAQKLMDKNGGDGGDTGAGNEELIDARFKQMFTNPLFEIDTESKDYQLVHPQAAFGKRSHRHADDSGGSDDDMDYSVKPSSAKRRGVEMVEVDEDAVDVGVRRSGVVPSVPLIGNSSSERRKELQEARHTATVPLSERVKRIGSGTGASQVRRAGSGNMEAVMSAAAIAEASKALKRNKEDRKHHVESDTEDGPRRHKRKQNKGAKRFGKKR